MEKYFGTIVLFSLILFALIFPLTRDVRHKSVNLPERYWFVATLRAIHDIVIVARCNIEDYAYATLSKRRLAKLRWLCVISKDVYLGLT